jgi:hypothetical protein
MENAKGRGAQEEQGRRSKRLRAVSCGSFDRAQGCHKRGASTCFVHFFDSFTCKNWLGLGLNFEMLRGVHECSRRTE